MSITTPKIISLFSGCGGMDLGFHDEGYKTVWANDINEWAAESFENYFGSGIITRDNIEDINPHIDKSIPDGDIVLGGFPCQDFSIIWKRPGLDGDRGNLYKNFLEFVAAKKPKVFVAENVKGLLSANNKKAIKQIIESFESIDPGYLLKIQLYNFAEYGVPQFRERVLIVGIRLDTGFNFHHPYPTHGPKADIPYVTVGEALKGVENISINNEHMNITCKTVEKLKLIPEGGNFTDIPRESPHYVKGMISHVYRRIHRNEPAKTIIAAGGGGTWGYHFPEERALTNRERARIQTFPDDFEFIGSTTEVRRQLGNAVPPAGVRLLAKTLKPIFTGKYEKTDLTAVSKKLRALPISTRIKYDYLHHENRDTDNKC